MSGLSQGDNDEMCAGMHILAKRYAGLWESKLRNWHDQGEINQPSLSRTEMVIVQHQLC